MQHFERPFLKIALIDVMALFAWAGSYDTGQGQFQSRNRVEMKYRPKDLSKVGIVYATESVNRVHTNDIHHTVYP